MNNDRYLLKRRFIGLFCSFFLPQIHVEDSNGVFYVCDYNVEWQRALWATYPFERFMFEFLAKNSSIFYKSGSVLFKLSRNLRYVKRTDDALIRMKGRKIVSVHTIRILRNGKLCKH